MRHDGTTNTSFTLPLNSLITLSVRPIEPPDHDEPRCPSCDRVIDAYDAHRTGCPNWGMLPEHWRDG